MIEMDYLKSQSPDYIKQINSRLELENQLQSYTRIFQTIADQIGELNEKVARLQNAAE